MLYMPRVLVLHEVLLALPEHFEDDGWDEWLIPEFRDGREDGFEVEDDGAGEGQAA